VHIFNIQKRFNFSAILSDRKDMKRSISDLRSEAWNRAREAQILLETVSLVRESDNSDPFSGFLVNFWRHRSAVQTIAWALGEDWDIPKEETFALFLNEAKAAS
jgi:hypothetical protein